MIRNRVAEVMGRVRIGKKELADRTGIRPNTISALWRGDSKRIEMWQMDRLCEELDCQPGDLFEYIPNKKGDQS